MTKAEKADYVRHSLQELYPETPIPLDHIDPYSLLIVVLLSAQCTDARVNKVSPHLFAKAKTPFEMTALEVDEIREIIKPCGLSPRKSKAISNLSQRLIDEHGCEVPADIEYLETLPGVGHKTASVVMSQAFGESAFPVDTHIHRLMYRWGLSTGKNVVKTEADAKRLFPKESWNTLHLQIIYYGREYSPARGFDLKKDFITRKIGRKSVIKDWMKKHPGVLEG
jgi:endonuclease-3